MTTEELHLKLQSICEDDITIMEVSFHEFKTTQRVIVIYGKTYSEKFHSIFVEYKDTIEEMILEFIDASKLNAEPMEKSVPSGNSRKGFLGYFKKD